MFIWICYNRGTSLLILYDILILCQISGPRLFMKLLQSYPEYYEEHRWNSKESQGCNSLVKSWCLYKKRQIVNVAIKNLVFNNTVWYTYSE